MKRHFSNARWIATILLSIAFASACITDTEATGEGPEQPRSLQETPLVREARAILDDIVAERWSDVRARFDATMMNELSEDGLAMAWEEFRIIKGDFEAAGNAEVVERPPVTVINIELVMSEGDVSFESRSIPRGASPASSF